ncbi:MAG: phage holin family protein [Chitinispirillales bacterium]|jgi:toxin secretion/phage lysis holin|nr:phage holin family protein [Chitinispirillales bacterium]
MKDILTVVSGLIGGFFGYLFGAWDKFLEALLIFMILDYVSGFITAAFFGNSPKSVSGKLLSSAMFKGLCKKCMILIFVIIGYKLDALLDTNYVKSMVVFAFIINELLSIIENAGRMGVPIPDVLKRAIETLNHSQNTDKEE